MIAASRIQPSIRLSYVGRNGGTGGYHSFLRSQGAVGNSRTEIESSWLVIKGGSGTRLNEQWGTYLDTKGFTIGSLEERMRAFLLTGTQA